MAHSKVAGFQAPCAGRFWALSDRGAEKYLGARTPQLPQEARKVTDLRQQLTQLERRRIDAAARRLAQDVEAHQREVTRIENTVKSTPEQLQQAITALDGLRSKINQSLDAAAADGVKEAEMKTAVLIHRYALNLRTEYSNRYQQDTLRQNVTHQVGHVARFEESLAKLRDSGHFDSAKAEIDTVLGEVQLWQEARRWNDLVSQPAFYALAQLTPDKAKEQLEAGQDLEKFPVLPVAEEFRNRRSYLEAIAGRLDEENRGLHQELQRFLDAPGIRGLWFVEFENGQWCYTVVQPSLSPGEHHVIDRVKNITADGIQTGRRSFSSRLKDPPRPASQSEVAEYAREALQQLNSANWENTFCDILAEIQDKDAMDPILKLVLIQAVIRVGQRGSAVLEEVLTEAAHVVNGHFISPHVKWYDCDDVDARRERKVATDVLQQLNKAARFSELKSIAAARIREAFRRPQHRYEWIGWLGRGSSGGWSSFLRDTDQPKSSPFFVLIPLPDRKGAEFVALEISPAGEISPATTGRFGRPLYRQTNGAVLDGQ